MSRSVQVVIQSQKGRGSPGSGICIGTAVLSSLWLTVKCQASPANQVRADEGFALVRLVRGLPKIPQPQIHTNPSLEIPNSLIHSTDTPIAPLHDHAVKRIGVSAKVESSKWKRGACRTGSLQFFQTFHDPLAVNEAHSPTYSDARR